MTTPEIDRWLADFLTSHEGVAGSVHHVRDGLLHLSGAARLPEPLMRATATIPRGKGMAGLAWERDAPVQTCNLQADTSGDVQPGARGVNAQGAVAFPVHDRAGGVRAIVGIAFADERVLDEGALARLVAAGASVP